MSSAPMQEVRAFNSTEVEIQRLCTLAAAISTRLPPCRDLLLGAIRRPLRLVAASFVWLRVAVCCWGCESLWAVALVRSAYEAPTTRSCNTVQAFRNMYMWCRWVFKPVLGPT